MTSCQSPACDDAGVFASPFDSPFDSPLALSLMIRACDMTFSAECSRRLPAFWPSVGWPNASVQGERAFIVFPDGFVARITRKYQRNEPAKNTNGIVGICPSHASLG
jgi:hypothetical protein